MGRVASVRFSPETPEMDWGFGAAIATVLAVAGAKVAINCLVDPEAARRLLKQSRCAGRMPTVGKARTSPGEVVGSNHRRKPTHETGH